MQILKKKHKHHVIELSRFEAELLIIGYLCLFIFLAISLLSMIAEFIFGLVIVSINNTIQYNKSKHIRLLVILVFDCIALKSTQNSAVRFFMLDSKKSRKLNPQNICPKTH